MTHLLAKLALPAVKISGLQIQRRQPHLGVLYVSAVNHNLRITDVGNYLLTVAELMRCDGVGSAAALHEVRHERIGSRSGKSVVRAICAAHATR